MVTEEQPSPRDRAIRPVGSDQRIEMGGHERVFIQMEEPDASVTWPQASKEKDSEHDDDSRKWRGDSLVICVWRSATHQIKVQAAGETRLDA